MEFVPGETLADRKVREPGHCFEWMEILPWIQQLCTVLDYAHNEGRIAHRDLKPRNLILTEDGRLKVADFGLAAIITESLTRPATRNDAVGTPPYMSPQQVLGKPPTRTDDMYALGATIYDLLTGRPPFFRGDIFGQVLHETAPSMAERRAELGVQQKAAIPSAWEYAVAACLSKDPIDRPANGAAFLEIVRQASDVVQPAPIVRVRVSKPAPVPVPARECNRMETTKVGNYAPRAPQSEPMKTATLSSPVRRWNSLSRRQSRPAATGILWNLFFTVTAAAVVAAGMHFVRRSIPAASRAPAAMTSNESESSKSEASGRLGSTSLEPASELGAVWREQRPPVPPGK
jgi:serine/threonine protein kinase